MFVYVVVCVTAACMTLSSFNAVCLKTFSHWQIFCRDVAGRAVITGNMSNAGVLCSHSLSENKSEQKCNGEDFILEYLMLHPASTPCTYQLFYS